MRYINFQLAEGEITDTSIKRSVHIRIYSTDPEEQILGINLFLNLL